MKRHHKNQGSSLDWTLSWIYSVSFYEASLRLGLTGSFTVLEIAADTVANKAFSVEHLSAEGYF